MSLYGDIVSLFHVGQKPKVPAHSSWIEASMVRCILQYWVCIAVYHNSGVLGRAPVANGFQIIFDRMELVFINCLPCQKNSARFWISWWWHTKSNVFDSFSLLFVIPEYCFLELYLFSFIWLKYISTIKTLCETPPGISWDSFGNFHMASWNPVKILLAFLFFMRVARIILTRILEPGHSETWTIL